jgi:hypothetical protein
MVRGVVSDYEARAAATQDLHLWQDSQQWSNVAVSATQLSQFAQHLTHLQNSKD